jgi:hypothetical protein
MTNEERDIITQFVARVGGAPAPVGSATGGPISPSQGLALPAVDQDADALIAQMFQRYPEARYRMTQLAFLQEQGLVQAQNRIHQLEADVALAHQAAQQALQAPQQQGGGGGFFGGLFGGGRQQSPAPPQPGQNPWGGQQPGYAPPPQQYAPGYQPGMFQRDGSGFLGSALTTAAGVAGGMVVGNMLTNMFTGGHHTGSAWGDPAYGSGANPWGAAAPVDQGAWDNSTPAAPSNQDYVDSGSWDQQPAQDASWSDNSSDSGIRDSDGGGSWDSGGGSNDSF